MDEANQLAGPGGDGFVRATMLLGIALSRGKRAEEGQGPDASRPGNGHEQHEAHPAQPAHFDEVAVTGAHRIALDAGRRDLGEYPFLPRRRSIVSSLNRLVAQSSRRSIVSSLNRLVAQSSRRSIVSSLKSTSGPSGAKAVTSKRSRMRLAPRLDQTARLRMR